MTTIILIRHGQTAWNRFPRFRGQANVPLDETGLWQAQVTGAYVAARWSLSAVYASPLDRAVKTAEAVASAQGLAVQTLSGLLDINFGILQGVAVADAQAQHAELIQDWFGTPHTAHFPNGEKLADVARRSTAALEETVTRHQTETVALVSHTVLNRVLLCTVLGLGLEHFWQLGQDTCAVNVIEWDNKTYTLSLLNDTSHLWKAARGT